MSRLQNNSFRSATSEAPVRIAILPSSQFVPSTETPVKTSKLPATSKSCTDRQARKTSVSWMLQCALARLNCRLFGTKLSRTHRGIVGASRRRNRKQPCVSYDHFVRLPERCQQRGRKQNLLKRHFWLRQCKLAGYRLAVLVTANSASGHEKGKQS